MLRGLVRVDPSCKNLLRDLRGGRLRQLPSGPAEDQRDGYSHSWVGMCYRLHQLFPTNTRTLPKGGASGKMVSYRRGTPVDAKDTMAHKVGL